MNQDRKLSPFLGPKRDALFRDFEAFLEIDGLDSNTWRFATLCASPGWPEPIDPDLAENLWMLEVDCILKDARLVLEIFPKYAPRYSWFRSEHFSFSYRSDDDDHTDVPNHLLEPVKELLLSRDPDKEASLFQSVERFSPFAHLNDDRYVFVHQKDDGFYGSVWLNFECNESCRFCWQNPLWPVPDTEQYKTWISEVVQMGVESLAFTGGEPTLREDLIDLIQLAVQVSQGLTFQDKVGIVLETNGLRLSDRDYTEKLRDVGVDEITIGLNASNATTSDGLTQTPGGFDKTVQGIHNCLDLGIAIHLQCVVDLDNLRDLPDHAEFVAHEFADKHPNHSIGKMTYIIPIPFADQERYRSHRVDLDALEPALPSMKATLESRGIQMIIQDR